MSKYQSCILPYEECQRDQRYNLIPQATITGLTAFIDEGMPVDDFLECLLSNDFMGAFMCADENNTHAMLQIARFMRNEIPGRSCGIWGTLDEVRAWVGRGGLKGYAV